MKRNKKTLMVCICLFLVSSIAAIILYCNLPKNTSISPIVDGVVTSITYEQSGEGFYYSAGTEIVHIDSNGEQTKVADLKSETAGERVFHIEALEDSGNIIAFSDNMTGHVLQEDKGNLEIRGSFSYSGQPVAIANNEKEVFVFYQVGNYCEVRAYNMEHISDDYVRRALLYNYGGNGDGVSLSLAKGLKIKSVSVVDDTLYVIHEGGLYKIDTSFSMNSFKYMSSEEREAAGVLSYNKNSYDVVVAEDKFDYDALAIYTTGVSGGCYRRADDRIYFITNSGNLMYLPINEIGTAPIGSELKLYEAADIVLSENSVAKPQLSYDRRSELGYVSFDITNELICIDFKAQEVLFRTSGEFNITGKVVNRDGSKLTFLYADTNESVNRELFIKMVDLEKQAHRDFVFHALIVSIVFTMITLFISVFMALRTFNEGYNQKVKITLKKMWKHKWIYVILIPSLAGLFLFCYYPGIASMGLSLFDYTAQKQSMKWNNFANYISIFTNKYSLEALRNMVIFLITDILVALIPPLIFAFFISFMRSKRYSNFIRTMLFIPGVIPGIATLLIWKTGIYGEYGVLNTLIELFHGEPVKFLTSSGSALYSIIMMGFPFVGSYLIFYGAIMNIADSYIEAAELEGCPLWKRIWQIDIPLILPQIKYVLIMTLISSAQNFGRVYMTTGGSWGTQIPINMMYNNLVSGNYGLSSAYATILFLLMFIPMLLNLKTQKKGME